MTAGLRRGLIILSVLCGLSAFMNAMWARGNFSLQAVAFFVGALFSLCGAGMCVVFFVLATTDDSTPKNSHSSQGD